MNCFEKLLNADQSMKIFLPNIVAFGFAIIMVIVGFMFDGDDFCQNGANRFLKIGGLVTISTSALSLLLARVDKLLENYGVIQCVYYIASIGHLVPFSVLIWGSVVVFGSYSTWDSKISGLNYCHQDPYVTAFTCLIINWIWQPIIITILYLEVVCKTIAIIIGIIMGIIALIGAMVIGLGRGLANGDFDFDDFLAP